jgi:hypothetical protein
VGRRVRRLARERREGKGVQASSPRPENRDPSPLIVGTPAGDSERRPRASGDNWPFRRHRVTLRLSPCPRSRRTGTLVRRTP